MFAVAATCASLLLAACPKQQPADTVRRDTAVPEIVREHTGIPVPLALPEGAHGHDDLDLLKPSFSAGHTNWRTQFHYDGGFDKIVASFDEQLAPQGFARLVGPLHDVDVSFTAESTKPTRAQGKKVWISEDRKIVVFLSYSFTRATETEPEHNDYVLTVLESEEPTEVKEPNKVVPIT